MFAVVHSMTTVHDSSQVYTSNTEHVYTYMFLNASRCCQHAPPLQAMLGRFYSISSQARISQLRSLCIAEHTDNSCEPCY